MRNIRFKSFIVILAALIIFSLFGWLPTNSISILKPLDGIINYLCIGALLLCIPLMFCRKTIGDKNLRISNFSYFSMIFTAGTGVGLLSWGFLEPYKLMVYPDCRGPLGLAIHHWTLVPWGLFALFTIFEVLDDEYDLLGKFKVVKDIIYSTVMVIGIATTYAIGVNTLSSTLYDLYNIVIPPYAFLILFGALTATSVLLGIQRGLKTFSNVVLIAYFVFLGSMIMLKPDGLLSSAKLAGVEFFRDLIYNHTYRGTPLQYEWTT